MCSLRKDEWNDQSSCKTMSLGRDLCDEKILYMNVDGNIRRPVKGRTTPVALMKAFQRMADSFKLLLLPNYLLFIYLLSALLFALNQSTGLLKVDPQDGRSDPCSRHQTTVTSLHSHWCGAAKTGTARFSSGSKEYTEGWLQEFIPLGTSQASFAERMS